VREFAGGWSDWKDRVSFAGAGTPAADRKRAAKVNGGGSDGSASASSRTRTDRPRKRSYKENRELESLPDRIAELEEEIEVLQHALADPALYTGDGGKVKELTSALDARQGELEAAFERWEELEAIGE
ncbi:MAG: ABC transporter ATP-binding protein, partial [Spirochaetia bacterium]